MAKVNKPQAKPAQEPKKEVTMVTVADLAAEYNVEGREIRVLLRANGMKAPEVDQPENGFGPRTKYSWPEGSKELAAVRKIIEEALESDEDEPEEEDKPAAATPKAKGKAKKGSEEDE